MRVQKGALESEAEKVNYCLGISPLFFSQEMIAESQR